MGKARGAVKMGAQVNGVVAETVHVAVGHMHDWWNYGLTGGAEAQARLGGSSLTRKQIEVQDILEPRGKDASGPESFNGTFSDPTRPQPP